jgi:hypothetical protein
MGLLREFVHKVARDEHVDLYRELPRELNPFGDLTQRYGDTDGKEIGLLSGADKQDPVLLGVSVPLL